MFKNYLKITLRNFLKQKTYSIINVAGLTIGIACCLVIASYVQRELSFDTFHERSSRIYRAIYVARSGDAEASIAATPAILGPLLVREFPEVEATTRFYHPGIFGPAIVRHGDKKFLEDGFSYADSTVFSLFSFDLLVGNRREVLSRPYTVVLSETAARRLFGVTNPVGQSIVVDNRRTFEVTGIMRDVPDNSHMRFDYLASFTSLSDWGSADETTWQAANFATYLLLGSKDDAAVLKSKMPELLTREGQGARDFLLQPLRDIRLHSEDIATDYADTGSSTYVYGFSVIAVLILLVACINYMNLATARAARRAREVGVRKVVGASRRQLIAQFVGESMMTTLVAFALAIGLVELVLPSVNGLLGTNLQVEYLANSSALLALIAFVLVIGFVAGSYPAMVLSGYRPVRVLKGDHESGSRGALFRKALVVFQFAVSAFLIIGALIVSDQLRYFREKKLGFDKDQFVVLPIGDRELLKAYPALKGAILQRSDISAVTAASAIPGNVRGGYRVDAEGMSDEDRLLMVGWRVDTDFVRTLGLQFASGRNFTGEPDHAEDYDYILNEVAARKLGWSNQEALGKKLNLHGRKGRVVGVLEDFHFASLHSEIGPLVLFVAPDEFDFCLAKVQTRDLSGTLDYLAKTWSAFAPHRPFEYKFLDLEFDSLYRAEEQIGRFFMLFALLAIFVACLGLFGLASFSAEQRTKEVGIRKVMGASPTGLVLLLTREFTKFVLLAILVASPIAYVIMNQWLRNFAYRVDIDLRVFLTAGLLALLVAVLTVSYQAAKAALANPVESLRYE